MHAVSSLCLKFAFKTNKLASNQLYRIIKFLCLIKNKDYSILL